MLGDLGHSSELYSDIYNSMDVSVEPGDFEFDIHRHFFPPTTGPVGVMPFSPSISTNFPHGTSASYTSYAPMDPYFLPGNMSISQRQPVSQQLYINTQLGPRLNDPESSTASSSPWNQLLDTPCSSLHPSFQPFVHVASPPSASGRIEMLIPDLDEASPSLLSPSSAFEGERFVDPTFPPPTESDVVTQALMSHILEWKRVIKLCGTGDFVPQTVYQPYTEADKKRYIKDVELHETIFFGLDNSPEWGIFLEDALQHKLLHLRDKDHPMFVGCGPSVSIRIQWPGYPAWSKQIPTMDFKTPKGPITRAKLAKNIANCVKRFFESVQNRPMEAESDRRWQIGKQRIGAGDLILVSLHHVSKGSWQPQLRLRRRSAYSAGRFPYS